MARMKTQILLALVVVLSLVASALALATAKASHILVETEGEVDEILEFLNDQPPESLAQVFGDVAKERSNCPTNLREGDLGEFSQGTMVPEFDQVVFNQEINKVHKVQTQFGWHLVLVRERTPDHEEL